MLARLLPSQDCPLELDRYAQSLQAALGACQAVQHYVYHQMAARNLRLAAAPKPGTQDAPASQVPSITLTKKRSIVAHSSGVNT